MAHAYSINGRIEAALDQCAIASDLAESAHWVNASVCLQPALSSGSMENIRLWLDRRPDPYGLWNPLMAEVRRHPEFPQVLEQLGLVDNWREFGWPDYCRPQGAARVQCE